jgi:DegV family protein with EDD domain
MPTVAVLTDSCASIPEKLIQELNIHWVAYYIHRGQEVLRDLVTIQRDEFLLWMLTATSLPTTASPGPGDYFKAYEELATQGVKEIVSIHMTSAGSGAYQAAKVAQEMAQELWPQLQIEVIDTQNVSLCQGWMAIEAARAALAGKTLNEIVTLVKKMIPVTKMIQTADTLKYLYMGGRIGLAQRWVGSLLNIKPLIGMENGIIVALGTAHSHQKAYQMMVNIVENAVGKMGQIKVAYVHAGALAEVEKLKQMVETRLTVAESFFAELSPALTIHTGPGTAGLCFYPIVA